MGREPIVDPVALTDQGIGWQGDAAAWQLLRQAIPRQVHTAGPERGQSAQRPDAASARR